MLEHFFERVNSTSQLMLFISVCLQICQTCSPKHTQITRQSQSSQPRSQTITTHSHAFTSTCEYSHSQTISSQICQIWWVLRTWGCLPSTPCCLYAGRLGWPHVSAWSHCWEDPLRDVTSLPGQPFPLPTLELPEGGAAREGSRRELRHGSRGGALGLSAWGPGPSWMW